MLRKLSLWFALLSATAAMAAAQNLLLGVHYSELVPTGFFTSTTDYGPLQVSTGTDTQGAVYLLVNGGVEAQSITAVSYLIKLTPAGDRVVYRNMLTFQPTAMAVDPAGNVYLAGNDFVQKLGTDGATVVYTTTIGQNLTLIGVAADATGRAYVTGWSSGSGFQTTPGVLQPTPPNPASGPDAFVVRLKPAGSIDYTTYLGGSSQAQPVGIAVDASGSAFVTGVAFLANFPVTPGAYLAASSIPNFVAASFLARFSPDGSTLIYSTFTDAQGDHAAAVAVDSADNAVVLLSNAAGTGSVVLRFNPQGTARLFSRSLPASHPSGLAVDAAGNTYVASPTGANYPVKNSLAACDANGSSALTVLDGIGNVLQSTYIPGSSGYAYTAPVVGLGANSTVYIVGSPTASYTPTRQLAGSQPGILFLTSFSQDAIASVVPLACLGNAASYDSTGIAGGELVSLFGQGLGPANGAGPEVDAQTGFPKQLNGVEVTFNGAAGPLLYVQDGQVNAIAPWSLQAGQTVQVCLVYNSAPTNCLARTVVAADPGVFTVDGTYAAALNQDGSFNSSSHPAPVGSVVTVFATGLGPINPPQPDGAIVGLPLPANVSPAAVFFYQPSIIGLIPSNLTINYAGPAPYQVAGVSQINFVVQNPGNWLYLDVNPEPALVAGEISAGFQVYTAQ